MDLTSKIDTNNQLNSRTPEEEQLRRFKHINTIFMDKYCDLVWFARSNPDKLVEEERFELVDQVIKSLKSVQWKYPEETEKLFEDETNWEHGFNSGILAYSRFLASYIEDMLWPVEEDEEDELDDIITIDGVKYTEMDGRKDAEDNFPELDT